MGKSGADVDVGWRRWSLYSICFWFVCRQGKSRRQLIRPGVVDSTDLSPVCFPHERGLLLCSSANFFPDTDASRHRIMTLKSISVSHADLCLHLFWGAQVLDVLAHLPASRDSGLQTLFKFPLAPGRRSLRVFAAMRHLIVLQGRMRNPRHQLFLCLCRYDLKGHW